jgi:hypothetical protein
MSIMFLAVCAEEVTCMSMHELIPGNQSRVEVQGGFAKIEDVDVLPWAAGQSKQPGVKVWRTLASETPVQVELNGPEVTALHCEFKLFGYHEAAVKWLIGKLVDSL